MVRATVWTVLAIIAVGFQSSLEPVIFAGTLEQYCIRCSQPGALLKVDALIAGEPLIVVSPSGDPADQVTRQAIAELFEGEWVDTESGYSRLRIRPETVLKQLELDRTVRFNPSRSCCRDGSYFLGINLEECFREVKGFPQCSVT